MFKALVTSGMDEMICFYVSMNLKKKLKITHKIILMFNIYFQLCNAAQM